MDDNRANLALLTEALSLRTDCMVLTATDGQAGVDMARSHSPDVILMDNNMPIMSGREAMRILREDPATAGIPIIAVSAAAMPNMVSSGLEQGYFRYLVKPYDLVDLTDAIDAAIDAAQGGAAPTRVRSRAQSHGFFFARPSRPAEARPRRGRRRATIQPSSASTSRRHAVAGLRVGPAGQQQAQRGVELVALRVGHQLVALRVRELQPQAAPAALLQRVDEILARDQALGRLLRLGVALVRAAADQRARHHAGIAFQRDARRVAGLQARHVDAGRAQRRHAGVQHEGDRRVDPLHRRAAAGRAVARAVRELRADGARVAERGEGRDDLGARQARVVRHAAGPVASASRASRPVRAAGRTAGRTPRATGRAGAATASNAASDGVLLEALQLQQARTLPAAPGPDDGLAAPRRAGEVDAGERASLRLGSGGRAARQGS